jgi:hypothetical protein
MSRRLFIECSTVLALAFAAVLASDGAEAAEKGTGVYLLGFRGPLAGFTPPPGVFFQNDLYVYSGEAGSGIQLPFGGEIIANVEATAILEMPTAVWVTQLQIAGGNLGFSATLPVGSLDIEASLGPFSVQDDIFTVGDPFVAAFLGWHAGNFHWQTGSPSTSRSAIIRKATSPTSRSIAGRPTCLLQRPGSTLLSGSMCRVPPA